MSKKSSKTSHVLNLLTNRTGIALDETVAPAASDQSPSGHDTVSSQEQAASMPAEPVQQAPAVSMPAEPVQQPAPYTSPAAPAVLRQRLGGESAAIPVQDQFSGPAQEQARPAEKPAAAKAAELSSQIRDALEQNLLVEEQALLEERERIEQILQQEEPPKIGDYVPEDFYDGDGVTNFSFNSLKEGDTLSSHEVQIHKEKKTPALFRLDTGADQLDCGFVNVFEEIVKSNAASLMEVLGVCMCPRCFNDVVALALNQLPPKYVVTEKGLLFSKAALYESQHNIDILSAITKACMQVKNSPRHNANDL